MMKRLIETVAVSILVLAPSVQGWSAIQFTNSNDEYLEIDQNLINSDVFTASCWFIYNNSPADRVLFWSGDLDATNVYFAMYIPTSDTVAFRAQNTTNTVAATTTNISVGALHHALAYSASATDRKVYLDGGGEGTNTTSVTGINALTDRFSIGHYADSSPGQAFNGNLSECAFWNVALTDAADRQALANGISPLLVKPENLILYFPMTNASDLREFVGGNVLTAFNTPTDAGTHPAIFNPSSQILQFAVAGVGGALTHIRMLNQPGAGEGPHKSQQLGGVLENE